MSISEVGSSNALRLDSGVLFANSGLPRTFHREPIRHRFEQVLELYCGETLGNVGPGETRGRDSELARNDFSRVWTVAAQCAQPLRRSALQFEKCGSRDEPGLKALGRRTEQDPQLLGRSRWLHRLI